LSFHDNNWKIADFGLTTQGSYDSDRTTRDANGTKSYRPPEILGSNGERRLFSQKSDIWSLGCIFFEIIVFKKAFRDDYAVLQYAEFHDELKPTIPTGYYASSYDLVPYLLDGMLSLNPQDRPTAAELYKTFAPTRLVPEPMGMPSGRFSWSPKPSHVVMMIVVSTVTVGCAIGFGLADDYHVLVNLVTYSFASISASLFFWHLYFWRRKKDALIWYRRALWARLFQINTIIVYWVTIVRDQKPPQLPQRCWRMDGIVTMRKTFLLSC
jgi:serine/threonine protein kinase